MLIIIAILTLASVGGILFTVFGGKINSDLFVYIPEDSETIKGLAFMEETFGIKGDAMMVVEGDLNDPELESIVKEVKSLEGVSQFMWYGDIKDAEKMLDGINSGDDFISNAIKNLLGGELKYDVTEVAAFLRQPVNPDEPDGKYSYVMLGMLDYSASTAEARGLLSDIKAMFSETGREVVATGMTNTSEQIFSGTLAEVPFYLLFALIAVIIILIVTTDSFIDPVVLLITLGVSIIVSMGTNFIYKDISIISFALASVLQLAVTMDYAIFFLHIYKEKRENDMGLADAAAEATSEVTSSILASCLTTVGGFLALFFMQFTLGADLGKVLVKAVITSLVCVIILQPTLTVVADRLTRKYRHRKLNLSFKRTATAVVKGRKVLVGIAAFAILPVFILQNFVDYSYFQIFPMPDEPTKHELVANELYNQMIICVPIIPKEGKTHKDFIAEIRQDEKIGSVISAFSIMDVDPNTVDLLLKNPAISSIAGDYIGSFFGEATDASGNKVNYTMYTLTILGGSEDMESRETYNRASRIASEYFDGCYTMGMLTGVTDMAAITPTDFLIVSGVSIAIILAVLMLLLMNVKQSLMLVALIEFGIWFNLAINVFLGSPLNFMVYILISSVQLGCTVDYAILMSTRYRESYVKLLGDKKAAATDAAKRSMFAITISASIIISVCMAVYFVSANMIVKQMTGLLARGGLISYLLVMIVLPGLLSYTAPTVTPSLKKRYGEIKKADDCAKLNAVPAAVTGVVRAELCSENGKVTVLQNADLYDKIK